MTVTRFVPATEASFEELAECATNQVFADEQMLYALIQARKEAGLSQRDLAEILGVKQPTVAKFEHHNGDPKLSTIQRYALAVGAHVRHEVIPAQEAQPNPVAAWNGQDESPQPLGDFTPTVRSVAPRLELLQGEWINCGPTAYDIVA